MILLSWVDDILYAGREETVAKFEKAIKDRFTIKTKHWAETYIGTDIGQEEDNSVITLSQEEHVQKTVQKFDLEAARKVSIPLDPNVSTNVNSTPLEDPPFYQQLVGSLSYISGTCRPDISFAVGYLAKFAHQPTKYTMKQAKKTLVCLRDTIHYRLEYRKLKQPFNVEL